MNNNSPSGLLLVNKPKGKTSFSLVSAIRKICNVQKVGHAGTLDPFASGVMILLIGKNYTRLSDSFIHQDKEYIGTLHLGVRTNSYDTEGEIISTSDIVPTEEQIIQVLSQFQGEISQTPPMFSAKKVQGKKLYELARKGIEIERKPQTVTVDIQFLSYEYPYLSLKIACSKGTYIRSLAEDIGLSLGCGAHLNSLTRTKSGPYCLADCIDGATLFEKPYPTSLPLKQIANTSTPTT